MASRRAILAALGLAAVLAVSPGGRAMAFGTAGEAEIPMKYYCLRGVHGSYIVIASSLSSATSTSVLEDDVSGELVPAGADGCEIPTVAQASSVFRAGRASTLAAQAPVPAAPHASPMVPIDLAQYLAVYNSQGVEAADAWALSQYYR